MSRAAAAQAEGSAGRGARRAGPWPRISVSVVQLAGFRGDAAGASAPAAAVHLPYLVKPWAASFLERAVWPVLRALSHSPLG